MSALPPTKEASQVASEQETGKSRPPKKWKSWLKMIPIILIAFVISFGTDILAKTNGHNLTQTELLQKAKQKQVVEVTYSDDTNLVVKLKGDSTKWKVTYPKALAGDTFRGLRDEGVPLKPDGEFPWWSLITFIMIVYWAPILFKFLGSLRKKIVAKKKGEVDEGSRPRTTFADVMGMPETVNELRKIVRALKNPKRYAKFGARLPAGVVFAGPPGNGKTLLAEAMAGEANIPLYTVTGASVRSKWIGDAGQAIRDIFDKARKHPVSIIFIDEGDTLGGRRSQESTDGGDQEHRAMLNELLAQMNFNRPGGKVFVIIATNYPELLDEALVRSGRIDLQVEVLPPDVKGRRAILGVHTKNKPLGDDVDLDAIAKSTTGFTGADLEALTNNAAVEALENEHIDGITAADFEHALTVKAAGLARKDLLVTPEDRRVTAFHEAGHTLCAAIQGDVPNPTSVTVLAHGRSGGHTRTTPDEGKQSQFISRSAAKQLLVMYMGGVVGEKLALDADFTNGASSDRVAATNLAIQMVCYWGMGSYNSAFDANWRNGPHKEEAWRQIEEFIDEAERTAIYLLLKHKKAFDELVEELLEKETLRTSDLLRYYNADEVSDQEFAALKEQFAPVINSVQRAERRFPLTNLLTTGASV